MSWIILVTAGLFEVVWATALKMSNGFKNPLADVVCIGGMALSFWFLSVAMKTLPMGTAYAVWTGIGAVGGVVVGIVAFGESASALRIASAALIVAGIVGLKLASNKGKLSMFRPMRRIKQQLSEEEALVPEHITCKRVHENRTTRS